MMAGTDAKVTVLMAVYNGEVYLSEAVCSILEQSFGDFEFLIVDDVPPTGPWKSSIVRDPRIRLLRNERNLGLAASLTGDWKSHPANISRGWTAMTSARGIG
jgi:glycosyltransferase involved in cell wall biosynthesis